MSEVRPWLKIAFARSLNRWVVFDKNGGYFPDNGDPKHVLHEETTFEKCSEWLEKYRKEVEK